MSVAWVGVAVAAIGTGIGASGALSPEQPDLGKSSKELADVEAALLPAKRQMEALAQQGGKGEVSFTDPKTGKTTTIPVDFTGIGSADVQGAVAQKMAKVQLDLAQKYDSQFIEQALAQEKLADPESFAARDKMDALIHQQINRVPDRPVADLLQKQVGDQLSAAKNGRLDDATKAILDAAVEKSLAARGGSGGQAGDFEAPLTTGFEGEARRKAAMDKAQAWLGSGATPEDTEYRREQQNLANLSAETTGQTPTSQFKNLSASQQGPTPVVQGQPLSQLPTNTTQTGASAALAGQAAQNSQANPWLAGMSTLLNIGSVAGKAGWQPFKTG